MRLFTSRYQQFHPTQGVAVRTTAGLPRWRLPYQLDHAARLVTPQRWMLSLDYQRFRAAYRTQLDERGFDTIAAELLGITVAAGDDRLVLLCFEDLTDTTTWCHRTIFASWLKDQTGQEVKELCRPPRPQAGYSQGTLI